MGNVYDFDAYRLLAIEDDTQADLVLKDMRDKLIDRDRLLSVIKNEINLLKAKYEQIILDTETATNQHKLLIRQYLNNVQMKETKTQYTYKLPTAKIVKHKIAEAVTLANPERLMAQLKETMPEYIRVKREIAWSDVKRDLQDVDGKLCLVSPETGEMIEADGISRVVVDTGRVTLKFDGGIDYDYEKDS